MKGTVYVLRVNGVISNDGVLEDMSLASRILKDTFSSPWPWPRQSSSWPRHLSPWLHRFTSQLFIFFAKVYVILQICRTSAQSFGFNIRPWLWPRGLKPLASHTLPWRASPWPWPWQSSLWPWSWQSSPKPWPRLWHLCLDSIIGEPVISCEFVLYNGLGRHRGLRPASIWSTILHYYYYSWSSTWLSGRTLVFDWRTFTGLHRTCSWWVRKSFIW